MWEAWEQSHEADIRSVEPGMDTYRPHAESVEVQPALPDG